ncbi:MAG TPA: NAD(P)H-hydrate epimerase, partial [Prolixibacteraceae bacterium]|nr:NAD(P)H-hydrate epimerase [Prolixibacteraceae bacterium]
MDEDKLYNQHLLMKIFLKDQIAQIDRQTITEEPVSETGLMERASNALAEWLIANYSTSSKIAVIAGPGNNGGDALAVARILSGLHFSIDLILPDFGRKRSEASQINLDRLTAMQSVPVVEVTESTGFPLLSKYDLIIDGLYGSGLSRPLTGFAGTVIGWINESGVEVISV